MVFICLKLDRVVPQIIPKWDSEVDSRSRVCTGQPPEETFYLQYFPTTPSVAAEYMFAIIMLPKMTFEHALQLSISSKTCFLVYDSLIILGGTVLRRPTNRPTDDDDLSGSCRRVLSLAMFFTRYSST